MGTIPTKEDFEQGPLRDHGVSVTLTPNNQTYDNVTGDREDSFGTPITISIVFENPNKVFELLNQGEQEGSESGDTKVRAFVKGDVSVNHEDKITWNDINFRVDAVSPRYFGANLIFNKVELFII